MDSGLVFGSRRVWLTSHDRFGLLLRLFISNLDQQMSLRFGLFLWYLSGKRKRKDQLISSTVTINDQQRWTTVTKNFDNHFSVQSHELRYSSSAVFWWLRRNEENIDDLTKEYVRHSCILSIIHISRHFYFLRHSFVILYQAFKWYKVNSCISVRVENFTSIT